MEADSADVIRSPGPRPDRAEPARPVTELFQAHHLELVRLAVLMVGDLATAEDVVQDAFEQRTELVDAFRALPARQREVLALRYYLDMSVADVSATLHLSEGAVRSTASRGLAALARILPKEP